MIVIQTQLPKNISETILYRYKYKFSRSPIDCISVPRTSMIQGFLSIIQQTLEEMAEQKQSDCDVSKDNESQVKDGENHRLYNQGGRND
jgi:hypothetical protein